MLGFPPMRSGGLTKYSIDLMLSQKRLGHYVAAVFPGNPSLFSRNISVCNDCEYCGIETYKIHNALLVPLLHGVKNTFSFIAGKEEGIDAFRLFFKNNHFDVLHIHTLMGLPIAFMLAAKEKGVKIVYTSHDYFGLCPRVSFIDNVGTVCENSAPEKCEICNKTAKSFLYLWLRNSKLLVLLKKILQR